jgi:hypothetical protein
MDTQKQADAKDGFADRLLSMLEWVAERDPMAAAKLVLDYGDDLSQEMAGRLVGCDDPAACGCGCV